MVCGNRQLKATLRNSSPFVGYQVSANRCPRVLRSRWRDSARSAATTLSFFIAWRALCLHPMAWKAAVISIQKSESEGRDMFDRSLDEFIVLLSPQQQQPRLARKLCRYHRAWGWERIEFRVGRLHFNVYFWTFRLCSGKLCTVVPTEYAITQHTTKFDKYLDNSW